MTAQEILDLSKDATNLLEDILREQVIDRRNILTQSKVGENQAYIEFYFQDGTLLDLSVVRDYSNDMKPVSVVVSRYLHDDDGYNRLFSETFKVS